MSGVITPLPHMTSWLEKGCYLYMSSSEYTALNGGLINIEIIGKDVEGNGLVRI
jgi:hypothetical protein